MKIIKRNGAEATFDISKIIMAVTKANAAVEEGDRMTPRQIQRIAESVELACQELGRSAAVERNYMSFFAIFVYVVNCIGS